MSSLQLLTLTQPSRAPAATCGIHAPLAVTETHAPTDARATAPGAGPGTTSLRDWSRQLVRLAARALLQELGLALGSACFAGFRATSQSSGNGCAAWCALVLVGAKSRLNGLPITNVFQAGGQFLAAFGGVVFLSQGPGTAVLLGGVLFAVPVSRSASAISCAAWAFSSRATRPPP